MYVRPYVCTYVCMAYMYLCTYLCMVYRYVCMHVCMVYMYGLYGAESYVWYICMHACMYVCMYVRHASNGGNSSAVQEHLRGGAQQVYSTRWALAAVKDDGSV